MDSQQQLMQQRALVVTFVVGGAVAVITVATFWWVVALALGPDLDAMAAAADAPYNNSDGAILITDAEPNEPTDARDPWLGEEAWQAGIQAGQEYIADFPEPQNVQVLEGMNTSQIWNYMIQMSQGLGVGCQYCHNINNFAEDPYTQKISARLMLLLVRDLNAQYMTTLPNWRGNYVRCDTCHVQQALGMPTVSEQFEKSIPPINVTLEPLDESGMPVRDPANLMPQKEAVLYYLYNYLVWDPYDASNPTSGRGSLSLTHEEGRTQDQVTINQNVMNLMSWSMGVGCTYCHNSRNFYAYEADIDAPQFTQEYAINRLKSQQMLLMTTFMAENWTRYVLPNPDIQDIAADELPIVDRQYILTVDDTNYPQTGCYTCHRGNAVPAAALNIADIPEGEGGVLLLPPVLRTAPEQQ